MPTSFIRDSILRLIKFRQLRPFLRGIAKKRYNLDVHDTATIARNVQLPKNLTIEAHAVILPTASIAPNVMLKAGSVLSGNAPRGSDMAGDPAEVVAFRQYQKKRDQIAPLAQAALYALIDNFQFESVLDVGCGDGWHAARLQEHGKAVTCVDLGYSLYYQNNQSRDGVEVVLSDYLSLQLDKQYDCIWLSHVLEHQLDVHIFLKKIHTDLKEEGILAITVPPLKADIVGGHINLFNMGLLLYRLILAGFDCAGAHCKQYGYNLSIIVKKRTISLPHIEYDTGDVEKLAPFFPFGAVEGFFGDIEQVNWPWPNE